MLKLEQMEFELEEDETTQAEAEALDERVSPRKEPKPRSERKPLPEHLKREEVIHSLTAIAARIAVLVCAISATTSLNSSSTFLRASRSSVTCGPSSPAQAVIAWSKRRRLRGRSNEAWLHRVSSHM